MANGRNLTVYLTSDVSKFRKGLGQAGTAMDKFRRGVAVSAAAAGTAVLAVGAATFEAAKAAAEDAAAQDRLARAMKNTTGASDAQVKAMEDYIETAGRKTGLDDGDMRNALGILMRYTKNSTRAQALNNVAAKISLATGKDYLTVVKALARAEDGQTAALKRLGIPVGEAAQNYADLAKANKDYAKAQDFANQVLADYGPKSKEYAKALEKVKEKADRIAQLKGGGVKWLAELNDQFKGAITDDANSYAGGLRRVNRAGSELIESFGKGALGDEGVAGDMDELADAMYRAQPAAEAAGKALNGMMVAILEQLPNFILGMQALPTVWDNFVNTISGGVTNARDWISPVPILGLGDDEAEAIRHAQAQQAARNDAYLAALVAALSPTNSYDTGSRLDTFSASSLYRYNPRAADAKTRGDGRGAQTDSRTRARP